MNEIIKKYKEISFESNSTRIWTYDNAKVNKLFYRVVFKLEVF